MKEVSIVVDGVTLIALDDFTMVEGKPRLRIALAYGAEIQTCIRYGGGFLAQNGMSDGTDAIPWWPWRYYAPVRSPCL